MIYNWLSVEARTTTSSLLAISLLHGWGKNSSKQQVELVCLPTVIFRCFPGCSHSKQQVKLAYLPTVIFRGFPGCSHNSNQITKNKTDNVPVNVTLRSANITTAVVEKQWVLHILSVCLQPYLPSMQSSRAVLYCRLWPVWLYHIFPHYLIKGMTDGKTLLNVIICFDSLHKFLLKLFPYQEKLKCDIIVSVLRSSRKEPVILVCEKYSSFITPHADLCSFRATSYWILLRNEKNFHTKFVEKNQNKYLIQNLSPPPPENCVLRQIMWGKYGRGWTGHKWQCKMVHALRMLNNPLKPNDPCSGRTAPLTSKLFILYIYSTNTVTEYFKHGIYSQSFPLQNAVCFIIQTYLVPVLFTFYIQGVLK